MKAYGLIKRHCRVPGHGHSHMRGLKRRKVYKSHHGYVCEITPELRRLESRSRIKRRWRSDLEV